MSNKRNKTLKMLALAALLAMPTSFANAATSVTEPKEYTLEVIHVNAQKRSEAENTVPISLDVKSVQDIEAGHIKNAEELLQTVPNVTLERAGVTGTAMSPYIAIRGIGSSEHDTDPSVGLFVDGVPFSNTRNYFTNLLDVEQVVVLRGPQGTLYGRNTLGGAINIVSKKPDPSKYESSISLEGGNYGQFLTEIVGNIPLMDGNAAVRGAFSYGSRGKVYENVGDYDLGEQNNIQGRISYFQMLGDSTTIDLSGDIQLQDQTHGAMMSMFDYEEGHRTFDVENPFGGINNAGGAKLEINHDFDIGHRLTAITGFRSSWFDYDGSQGPVGFYDNMSAFHNMPTDMGGFGFTGFQFRKYGGYEEEFFQISQELRITSPEDSAFKYIAGLYGDYSEASRLNYAANTWTAGSAVVPSTLASNYGDISIKGDQESYSIAAFVDGSYDFNEYLQVFAGARVGYDDKKFRFNGSSNLGAAYLNEYWAVGGKAPVQEYDDNWTNVYVTPRAGIKYSINENNNIYASISSGYKAGGFTAALTYDESTFEFDEETTINYELGMKNIFFAGQVTLNTSAFYIDWNDQQVLAWNPIQNTATIVNAPKSRSYGFEVDLEGKFENGIRVGGGLGYADATYEKFKDATLTEGRGNFDARGKQQQYHSKFTAKASLGYSHALPWNELIADFDVTYRYRSKYYFDVENRIEQPGYGTVDATLGMGNDSFKIDLWVRNLFNQTSYTSATYIGAGNRGFTENILTTPADPCMFGATVTLTF